MSDYQHDNSDKNLMGLQNAMAYDEDGEPVLRVSIEKLAPGVDMTISGDVIVSEITGTVEINNDTGNPIPVSGSVEISNDVGNPIPVSATIGNPINIIAPVGSTDYYGEAYAVQLTPIVQLNSYEGVSERDSQYYTGGGGTVHENDTDIVISTTSTLGSYAVYRTKRFIPYRAGQTNVARALCRFDSPKAGTQQRIGIANQESGYYVGFNGTDFRFLHTFGGRAEVWELTITAAATANQTITLTLNGIAYDIVILSDDTTNTIAQKINRVLHPTDPWLTDQIDNTVRILSSTLGDLPGAFTFASTGDVTATLVEKINGVAATEEWEDMGTLPEWLETNKYNHWQFQYSWSGVVVFVLNHQNNTWYPLYRHVLDTGESLELPVRKPSFKVTSVVYNTGGTEVVNMRVASLFGAIEGQEAITKFTHGGGITQSSLNGGAY